MITRICIDKNRGWRGLAKVDVYEQDDVTMTCKTTNQMIFSFSQDVWEDLLKGFIVLQDNDNYLVFEFNHTDRLPKPTQQRSVLIKSFVAEVVNSWVIPKSNWTDEGLKTGHYDKISHFIRNSNAHTTSDWNCIGIRVIPNI